MELFDYKPRLVEFQGQDLPDSVRKGQRLTGMSASQSSFPVVPSKFKFAQHGKSGAWVSELLPHTAKIADQLTFVKSINTEAINHDPAVTMLQTGSQTRRPSQHGRLDLLRHRQRNRGPARVRRHDLTRQAAAASRSTTASGAAAFCPANIRA